MAQATKSVNPAALVDCKSASLLTGYANPIGNSASNTTYAQCDIPTGSGAEGYIIYKFDLSSIPDGAEIISVSCSAKGYVSNTTTNRIATRQMQMFSGSTAKGSATTLTTSATAASMSVGTWTLSELRNARIRVYAKRGSSSTTTSYYLRFYGATLTVVYDYDSTRYLVKTGASQWKPVAQLFEKTSSGLVERSVRYMLDSGVKLKYAGAFNPGPLRDCTVTITNELDSSASKSNSGVEISGVKRTGGTYTVKKGDSIVLSIGPVSGLGVTYYYAFDVEGKTMQEGDNSPGEKKTYVLSVKKDTNVRIVEEYRMDNPQHAYYCIAFYVSTT